MNDYKIFYRGIYDDDEKVILEDFQKQLDAKKSLGNEVQKIEVSMESMLQYAKVWNPYNPLFCDQEYGKSTKYGSIIGIPCFVEVPAYPTFMPRALGIFEVEGMQLFPGFGFDNEQYFFLPIKPGDILWARNCKCNYEDISHDGGEIRAFRISATAELYNQNDELVGKGVTRQVEGFKKFEDPCGKTVDEHGKMIDMSQHRQAHIYSEDDWEFIRNLWDKEYIRGKETLFWEDVNIGDQPAWTCDGPITIMEMIRLHGNRAINSPPLRLTLKDKNNPSIIRLEKDKFGMYYDDSTYHYCDVLLPGSRPRYFNTTGREQVIRMVTNWCGDDGFVTKIAWRLIIQQPKDKQKNIFPEDYDRPSYLFNVPYLKAQGKFMNAHGLVGDISICKGYIYDKYEKDGEYFVEMACWIETIEGDIIQECSATVKLPSRKK